MAELKTQRNEASVDAFLDSIEEESKRADARIICGLLQDVTGEGPEMWGSSIVGFGIRRAQYANGKGVDWMVVGFSPRKANLTLYLPGGIARLHPYLERLGPHKTGGGCLYVKRLSDVDLGVLREVVEDAVRTFRGE